MPIGRKGEERRTELLRVALELFSTYGFDGTSTRAIAKAADVTEALIFRYFPTKRDLFAEVVQEFGPEQRMYVPYEPYRSLPIREALSQALTAYLDAFWENRALIRMLMQATRNDAIASQSYRNQFASGKLRLMRMLAEREESGELQPDTAAALTNVVSAALSGFMIRSVQTEPMQWAEERDGFLGQLLRITLEGAQTRGPHDADGTVRRA